MIPLNARSEEEKMEIFWAKSEQLRAAAISGDQRRLFVWFQEFVALAEGHLRADNDQLRKQLEEAMKEKK